MSGPCAFCGHPDNRHRVIDTMNERKAAGEPWDRVLADYGYTQEQYEKIRDEVDAAERKKHD